jgi:hypothetical protein
MGISWRFGVDVGHCDLHLRVVPTKKVVITDIENAPGWPDDAINTAAMMSRNRTAYHLKLHPAIIAFRYPIINFH